MQLIQHTHKCLKKHLILIATSIMTHVNDQQNNLKVLHLISCFHDLEGKKSDRQLPTNFEQ